MNNDTTGLEQKHSDVLERCFRDKNAVPKVTNVLEAYTLILPKLTPRQALKAISLLPTSENDDGQNVVEGSSSDSGNGTTPSVVTSSIAEEA